VHVVCQSAAYEAPEGYWKIAWSPCHIGSMLTSVKTVSLPLHFDD
jgi:hypothetical protein